MNTKYIRYFLGLTQMLSALHLVIYPILSFSELGKELEVTSLLTSLLLATIILLTKSFKAHLLKGNFWLLLNKTFFIFLLAFMFGRNGLPEGWPEWMSHFFFR